MPINAVSVNSLVTLAHPARSLSLKRRRIRARLSDAFQSRFRGRGMEYDESRPYQPGDDVRLLDWRVTARTNETHTKVFREERERPVFLWVDYRPPMFFATRGRFKSVISAEIAALFAWCAVHEGDRVGGGVFYGETHHEIKPARGRFGALQLFHWLEQPPQEDGSGGSLQQPVRRISHIAHPGSLVILVSDFRGLDEATEMLVVQLARHSEILMVCVNDPLEEQLPPPGRYWVGDGHRRLDFSTRDRGFSDRYHRRFSDRLKRAEVLAHRSRSAFLRCRTNDDPFAQLQTGFGTNG